MKQKVLEDPGRFKWLMLALGLAACLFTNGRWNIPYASWIWPFCILFYFRTSKAAVFKFLPLPLLLAAAFFKWHGVGGGSLLQEFLLGTVNGLLFYLPFLIDALLYSRVKGFKATLLLPLSFASLEYLMSLTPAATSDCLAASQVGNLPLMQLASVCGVYGITFLIVWFASAAMYLLERRDRFNEYRLPVLIYAISLAAVLLFGGARLAFAPSDHPTVKMAMTTGIDMGNFLDAVDTLPVETSVASMQRSVKTAANGGAELIVFNEEAFTVYDADLDLMLASVKEAAVQNRIAVLLGLEIEDTDGSAGGLGENKLYLVDPQGEIVFSYDKTHLVPVVETNGYIKGDGIVPNAELTLPSGNRIKLAAVICMDSAFPGFVRDGVASDTQVYCVPAWDWEPIDDYQDHWVVYRSVENGFSTVYCTYDGLLAVYDQYGKVVTSNDTDAVGFENVMFAAVPVKRVFTLYKAAGFWIDLCYPALLLLVVATGLKKKKQTAADH